jgi:hypothetical protein
MDRAEQAGKKIGKIQKEAGLNLRRKTENFLQPGRIVNSFNKLHPYRSSFTTTGPDSTAILSIKIYEYPIDCAVNPPILNVSTQAYFQDSNPGTITRLANTTSAVNPPDPDFTLVNNTSIVVPVSGCYSILWQSHAWGVGYYGDKYVTVEIFHNFKNIRYLQRPPTNVIIILGPWIYSYAPSSPVYAVAECLAGDTIQASLSQNNIGEGYNWFVEDHLRGFFHNPEGLGLTITLVAEADSYE